MHLRTAGGSVELRVYHGRDPSLGRWGGPIRQQWGLSAHQQLSPGLQERLAFTVTATGTYAQAAAVAAKWGCPIDEATLKALVQRLGSRAEARTKQRLATTPAEALPPPAPSALMVLQLDGWPRSERGWQVRQRGPGWGRKTTNKPRVEWHELKTGVAYRHEQAGQTAGGRGVVCEKVVVSWQGEPLELGRRRTVDLARGGGSVDGCDPVAGLLPRQPTSLGRGPRVEPWRRSAGGGVGRAAPASVAPRQGARAAAGTGGPAPAAWPGR